MKLFHIRIYDTDIFMINTLTYYILDGTRICTRPYQIIVVWPSRKWHIFSHCLMIVGLNFVGDIR